MWLGLGNWPHTMANQRVLKPHTHTFSPLPWKPVLIITLWGTASEPELGARLWGHAEVMSTWRWLPSLAFCQWCC